MKTSLVALLPSLVNGPGFTSISSPVPEIWQFSFTRDWSEIQKSEIPPSDFSPIFGDWGELGMPVWEKCYWILQNAKATAFTVSELLKGNHQGGKFTAPRLGLTNEQQKLYGNEKLCCICTDKHVKQYRKFRTSFILHGNIEMLHIAYIN